MKCPYCSKEYTEEERFCEICGTPLKTRSLDKPQSSSVREPSSFMVQCRHCGKMHPASITFCPTKGEELGEAVPSPAPKPTSPLRAKLVLSDNDEIRIDGAVMTLGRRDFFRVAPPDNLAYISREHVRIHFNGGIYYIEDKDSRNGTWLNSDYITGKEKQSLKDGDIIDIGNVVVATFKTY